MSQSYDVLIVGGGFTGTSLACALSDGVRRILVLEARPGSRRAFAGELIHPTGVEILEKLSLRAPLERAGAIRIEGFAVYRTPTELPTLLAYQGAPGIRTTGIAFDHNRMVEVLREEAAKRPGVEVRYGARVAAPLYEHGCVAGVRTTDDEEFRAALVLGAEGRHSRLRATLGIPVESKLLSYTAALRLGGARLPHPRFGHIFLGAPGPVLAYPNGGDEARLCFDLPEASHPTDLADRLRDAYLPYLPEPLATDVRRALESEAPELVATHAMRAARAVSGGMALVGDAGACAHPLTAGGMTLCLNDVQILARALSGGAPQAALQSYERERVEMLVARIALTDALYEIFSRQDEGHRALREGVFRYWRAPRARQASVSLLAGADLHRSHLAHEYAQVLGAALLAKTGRADMILKTALGHGSRFLRGLLTRAHVHEQPAGRS